MSSSWSVREVYCGGRERGDLTSGLLLEMTIWEKSFELDTLIYPLVTDLGILFDLYLTRQKVGSRVDACLLATNESG